MAQNVSTQLSGQIGENLLVAELGRRGILATTLSGNAPVIDVLAYKNEKSIPIQVKGQKKGNISVPKAEVYLQIEFDGDTQIVKRKKLGIDKNLIFVIIIIGKNLGDDRFYICKQGFIQDIVYRNHKNYLEKHNGVRPRNPKSTHCAYKEEDLIDMKDNWKLIDDALK